MSAGADLANIRCFVDSFFGFPITCGESRTGALRASRFKYFDPIPLLFCSTRLPRRFPRSGECRAGGTRVVMRWAAV